MFVTNQNCSHLELFEKGEKSVRTTADNKAFYCLCDSCINWDTGLLSLPDSWIIVTSCSLTHTLFIWCKYKSCNGWMISSHSLYKHWTIFVFPFRIVFENEVSFFNFIYHSNSLYFHLDFFHIYSINVKKILLHLSE